MVSPTGGALWHHALPSPVLWHSMSGSAWWSGTLHWLRSKRNGWHFAEDTFNSIFLEEIFDILFFMTFSIAFSWKKYLTFYFSWRFQRTVMKKSKDLGIVYQENVFENIIWAFSDHLCSDVKVINSQTRISHNYRVTPNPGPNRPSIDLSL